MERSAPLSASTRSTAKVMKKPCGGGVEVAFEVQEPQAADRPEVDGESLQVRGRACHRICLKWSSNGENGAAK